MAGANHGQLQYKEIAGRQMAYVDERHRRRHRRPARQPHLVPTCGAMSCHLWKRLGRLVACDLIGMGASDTLSESAPDRYHYAEHRNHPCRISNRVSFGDAVTCADGDRLSGCHRRFVSDSRHFFLQDRRNRDPLSSSGADLVPSRSSRGPSVRP